MENSLYNESYRLLRRSIKVIKNELCKKVEDNNITWQQFHALYHIDIKGIPSIQLAKELNCNASNMTGLIDRMTDNGWVYRKQSDTDRRVWFVKLTDEGLSLKNKLLPLHNENIKQRMSVLNKRELEDLKYLLTKLMNNKEGEH